MHHPPHPHPAPPPMVGHGPYPNAAAPGRFAPPGPGGGTPVVAIGPPPAGWGARAGAYLVDLALAWPVVYAILWGGLQLTTGLTGGQTPATQEQLSPAITAGLLPFLTLLLNFAYFSTLHALTGQTLGKRLFGIKVISLQTGEPPTLGRSATRQLARGALFLAGITGLLIDLLWPLWDKPYRQALHDMAGHTRVVRVRGSQAWDPAPAHPAAPGPPPAYPAPAP